MEKVPSFVPESGAGMGERVSAGKAMKAGIRESISFTD
jgi:hypothetical protein